MQHTSPTSAPGRSPSKVAVGYLRRSTDRQEQSRPEEGDRALRRRERLRPSPVLRRRRHQRNERPSSTWLPGDHGVEVLYVGENFSGDSTDDLLRPVKQWQAREESKDLSKVTIRGLLSRIEQGYWNGGAPPHGYDLRYESPSEDGGPFLFVLRFQPDGTKLVLDETGATVRSLARGERPQVSKRAPGDHQPPRLFEAAQSARSTRSGSEVQRREGRPRPGA